MRSYKKTEKIKNFWEERAKIYKNNPRATTEDFHLREMEVSAIVKALENINNKKEILDIGCGDGLSTLRIAKRFPKSNFIGVDFSENMISNAKNFLENDFLNIKDRISFKLADVINLKLDKVLDVIMTDRCIINIPSRLMQKKAIAKIAESLKKGGYYIMMENFIEGQEELNKIRKRLGLKKIRIKWHNLFLDDDFVKNEISKFFIVERTENILSLYYLITRIVYSKLCQLNGEDPKYDNVFYEIASKIDDNCGNFGPINLLILKKK